MIKALYKFPTSVNIWKSLLLHTLRGMVFKSTRFDPDVWIKGREGGYGYIGTHTDDVLVVTVDTNSIIDKLKETYTIKTFGAPKFRLVCDYMKVKVGATTQWVNVSSIYTTKSFWKVCVFYKVTNLRKYKFTSSPEYHPELYLSPLLGEEQHRLYQKFFGMVEWMVQIGIF